MYYIICHAFMDFFLIFLEFFRFLIFISLWFLDEMFWISLWDFLDFLANLFSYICISWHRLLCDAFVKQCRQIFVNVCKSQEEKWKWIWSLASERRFFVNGPAWPNWLLQDLHLCKWAKLPLKLLDKLSFSFCF